MLGRQNSRLDSRYDCDNFPVWRPEAQDDLHPKAHPMLNPIPDDLKNRAKIQTAL